MCVSSTDAVERAAGPQREGHQLIITHADLVRGFEEMAAERTEADRIMGNKPLEPGPAAP